MLKKKILKERVNNRKKIIEDELKGKSNTEAKKEEKSKEEESKKKKEELITKKSLSPMYNVSKDKEEDEKKRLTQVVTDRLNEYRAAMDYFKTHGFSEQQTNKVDYFETIKNETKKPQKNNIISLNLK